MTVRTNATDTSVVRQNQSPGLNSVPVTNIYDLNKDGRVNATDTALVRQNQSNLILRYFTAPASLQFATLVGEELLSTPPIDALSLSSDEDAATTLSAADIDHYFVELGNEI